MKIITFDKVIKSNKAITLQFTKYITLNTSKYRLILSALLTAILFGVVLFNTATFIQSDVPHSTILYALCLFGSVLIGLVVSFKYTVPKDIEKSITILSILFIPIGTMAMVECLNGIYIGNWHFLSWLFNAIFYSLLYLVVFAFFGSRKLPFLVINPILYLISMINHYVMAFRGTPFLPMDFLYTETAANVTGSYEFTLDYQVILSTILFVLLQCVAWKIKTPKKKLWKKILSRTAAGALSLSILISYFTSNTLADIGFSPDFFNQTRGYQTLGVAMSFFMNTKYLMVSEPETYSAENIEASMQKVIGENKTTSKNGTETNKKTPNIICIMNESLSDLSVLGDVNTNKDYMPFLRNLTENTVKGNLYVPVIGSGTSNTEFEFLTGSSTAFLPSGSNAYTLYVNHNLLTTVNTLKNHGYCATAFHPYFEKNWNRINAYNYIGFNKYYGIETILNKNIVSLMSANANSEKIIKQTAKQYPNEELLTRLYVNDSFNYKKVIEEYEQKNSNTPFYMFNVTMQNHGGYEKQYSNFNEEIYLIDKNGDKVNTYPQTNQYLSLVYESDKAFEELIKYFKAQDEPTIICMFGDHQPAIENEFVEKTLGADSIHNLTVEQTQARYVTPFYIWANYDIEEKEIDKLSVNYLSSYLMDIIGLEMPTYNQYLLKLSETLPVINTVGYIDAEDNYYTYETDSKYSQLIKDYENICYNYLIDENNRCDWLYTINKARK